MEVPISTYDALLKEGISKGRKKSFSYNGHITLKAKRCQLIYFLYSM